MVFLKKNLYSIYRCVEKISLLRVLSILHMFIVMPLRWLSGNCEKLAEWDFGVADMPQTVDLMDKAFKRISEDGTLIYNAEFMESIFDPIKDKVSPFGGFYTYMFEHKKSNPIGCYSEEDKVLPWDLLRSAVMFPTRRDILQSNTFTSELAVQAAVIFREEF